MPLELASRVSTIENSKREQRKFHKKTLPSKIAAAYRLTWMFAINRDLEARREEELGDDEEDEEEEEEKEKKEESESKESENRRTEKTKTRKKQKNPFLSLTHLIPHDWNGAWPHRSRMGKEEGFA